MVLGKFVCVILCRSLCKCTVSNAFDMSSAIAIVLSGGFFLLKPVVIVVCIVFRAVIVKCFVLNLCWCVWLCKLFVMRGKIIFFSVLAIGDRRAMGLAFLWVFVWFGDGGNFTEFQDMRYLVLIAADVIYVCKVCYCFLT